MPEVRRTALVMHSAEQMYQLVNDVDRYPEFLPGCVASQVFEESNGHMLAELTLRKGPVSQVFSTSNTLTPNEKIAMELSNGPFEYLKGSWTFKPLSEEACKIAFELDFELMMVIVAVQSGVAVKDPQQIVTMQRRYLDQRANELALLEMATQRGITVSDDVLNMGLNDFMIDLGFQAYNKRNLAKLGIVEEQQLQSYVREKLMMSKLMLQIKSELQGDENDTAIRQRITEFTERH